MELKEYQAAALDAFVRWRDALEKAREQADALAAVMESIADAVVPPDIQNYPKAAWTALTQAGGVADGAGVYVSRTDEAGRPIPHVCFKVPTGGGKTLLAAAALERLNRPNGLVLWITPTKAIYAQTKAALRDREHPYRQMLERASGGRVKLMEKDNPLTRQDAADRLCVMLLSLPAANRQRSRDFLRMFRDSGRYPTLFPDGDDPLGNGRLLADFPDLERAPDGGPVIQSLFNVFKILRPAVILDEAHKAYGKPDAAREFVRVINRLDPSLVIELSATPHRGVSNLLVDITGEALKKEEMIKLPVRVESWPNAEWKTTLADAAAQLERLTAEARSLQASEGRYVRPIAVVRVERTGRDQRDGERVHAEDVRDYLTLNLGVPASAVKVKSSELDELAGLDLLSEICPVQWIITKAALMEGWDCPFAYLLVMLDNTRSERALTQLTGRVMRQPHARRTGREALDQCYVYCWKTDVSAAVAQVKRGLEQEGLTGLGEDVLGGSAEFRGTLFERRPQFRGKDIFLPLVRHKDEGREDGEGWRELDYQRHILPAIDWDAIAAPDPQSSMPDRVRRQSATVDVGAQAPVFHGETELSLDKTLSVSWFARRLADVIPNPWQAARVAQDLLKRLRDNGDSDDHIYDRRSYLSFALREHVRDEVEKQAEQVFADKLIEGAIRFDLDVGEPKFTMVDDFELPIPVRAGLLPSEDGRTTMQISLFEPVYDHGLNALERKFAQYLDKQKALRWWHRVAARQRGDYYLRGWKQDRIWPDFIAMADASGAKPRVLVFETKGEHLRGNPDTDYKQRVMDTLQDALSYGVMRVNGGPLEGTFQLVFSEDDFPRAMARASAENET